MDAIGLNAERSQQFNASLFHYFEVIFMKKWFLLLSVGALLFIPKTNSWADDFSETPKIVVRGEASIFKPSDQMEVTLGVVTISESSSVALNENNQRMHQVVANLQALGLDDKDYQTGRFQIHPIYHKPPKGSKEEEHTKISRYEVVNAIQVKTAKINLADKIIGVAVEGGANQIDQVNFNLVNPQAYRAEAIQVAAKYALDDASALANAVGVKLKRVLSVSLEHWQQTPAPVMLFKRAEGESHQNHSISQDVIESGRTEIHAIVNVTFEIGE